MPTCMFEMCGTDIPGVSNRYIKGWSHTWIRDSMSVVSITISCSASGKECVIFNYLLQITRIRSEVDLVHPGLAPTGAGLPPTFEQFHC